MKTLSAKAKISGLTLVEVLAVIFVIAVLAAMMLPAVGGPRMARRIICSNNLKSIDESFVAWSQGHDGKLPMQFSETNGGSMDFISSGSAVVHFLTLTNSKLPLIERGTKFFSRDGTNVSEPYSITNYGLKRDMLVCPSDSSRHDGIYQKKSNAEITDTNISYFVGVDATLNNPKSILSGDRNLRVDNIPAKPGLLALTPKSSVGWTEELHFSKSIANSGGNILFADGHVEYLKSKALNSVFPATNRFAIP
jgi:prepilin-type processing-associated H-X9-DG protein